MFWQYFRTSLLVSALGLGAGYFLGGWSAVWIVFVLSLLEISLSFDNAVVNATILKDMTPAWRQRFIRWGIPIAVFGMRLVFPVLIVAITTKSSPWDILIMAAKQPDDYAKALTAVHHQISAFGGTFLFMVFLKYFVDSEKDTHWLSLLEKPLSRLGKMEAFEITICLAVLLAITSFLQPEIKLEFFVSGVWGLVTFLLADGFSALLEGKDHTGQIVRSGFASFMYLELLDASFSFDGVIGAFALSHNLFIIAVGLGVGAMFVRSLTIFMVDRGTLAAYKFLEHGAFWAIGVLAIIMYLSAMEVHIPEWFTGFIGAVLILLSLLASIKANKVRESR